MSLSENIGDALMIETRPEPKELAKLRKARQRKVDKVATVDAIDKVAALRDLVGRHRNMMRAATRMAQPTKDRKLRDGTVVKSNYDAEAAADLDAAAKVQKRHAKKLEAQMVRLMRGMPIYDLFLAPAFGIGPIVAANMIARIDITKAPKVSNLRRYCGLAVIGGALERVANAPKSQGGAGCPNDHMRTVLFQGFAAMARNAGSKKTCNWKTSKYIQVWSDYLHRMAHSERVSEAGTIVPIGRDGAKPVSAKNFIRATGWHKAADVFVEDYYTIARTLAGLPVWPSYHAAKLGYAHGGKVCVDAPRMLTLDEALEIVGDVRGIPTDRQMLPKWDDLGGDEEE